MLRSLTQGRGYFRFEFARYEEAPANIAQKVVEGKLRDRSHVLISIDQDGNYECTVEEPLELDAMPLDDLLTEGDK